jgi:formylglycine-generating enzyme required for sulfatase activity
MRFPLLRACLVLLAATTATSARSETRKGVESATSVILTGRVEQVYTKEKQLSNHETDTLFAIEVHVTKDSTVDGKFLGRKIFVKTWQTARRPDGWKGPPGQTEVPGRGDIAEFNLTGGPGTFEAVVPDGIRIVLPASCKSEATDLGLTLVHAGEFLMGAPGTDAHRRPDELQHPVKITRPFYLGTYEVTQWEYKQVMQSKPSAFSLGGGSKDKVPRMITDRFPVESVTWFDAVEFCNRLSRKDGFEPYYTITDAVKEAASTVNATVAIRGGAGYRLPTEAEWEYACRAGTTTPFHYGNESSIGTSNVKALIVPSGYGTAPKFKELGRTAKVGSYPPNDWGLFDMHGNVEEWCDDWYDKESYANAPREDPKGANEGLYKVARGGSWLVNDVNCRAASRIFHMPREAKYYGGFRVARTP